MPRTNDDPRARRSRATALAAATELLAEGGPGHITHAAVAARAKVGRATVYRHWPDLQALLLDTLTSAAHPVLTLGHGPFRDELVTYLQQQADWLNRPVSASVIATIMERAERDPAVRSLRDEMSGRVSSTSPTRSPPPSHAVNCALASKNTPGTWPPGSSALCSSCGSCSAHSRTGRRWPTQSTPP